MARRGRMTKIQAEQVNTLSTVLHYETEPSVDANDVNFIGVTSDEEVQPKQSPRKEKTRTSEVTPSSVRRSVRLVNTLIQANSVKHDIVVVGGEEEEVLPPKEENQSHEESQEMKDEPAAQLPSPVERVSLAKLNYRSMYITSQKKVRKLIKKNRQLRENLEYANGQIKAYAEITPIVSSLSKANKLLCNRPWSAKRLRT